MMTGFKQAQANWDNMEPPEPTEQVEKLTEICFSCDKELDINNALYEIKDKYKEYPYCQDCVKYLLKYEAWNE